MQLRKRVLVPQGMAHVAAEPAILTTTVGREFAVAVTARSAEVRSGGLINLVVSQNMSAGANGETTPQRLVRFLRDVKVATGDVGAGAVLIGGADTLAMMPAASWLEWVTRMGEILADAIHYAGIELIRKDIGGRMSRLVALDLFDGGLEVELFGRESESAAALPRTPPPRPAEPESRDFNVDIGAARVEHSPHRLVAILGSCVGIALYDPSTRIGGLVHAAMPKHPDGNSDPMRYADTAVPSLLAQMQSQGADREKIVAKIAGGAHSLQFGDRSWFTIPGDNVRRAREALSRAGIPLLAEHVGGRNGRKIVVDLRTFRVSVTWLDNAAATAIGGAG